MGPGHKVGYSPQSLSPCQRILSALTSTSRGRSGVGRTYFHCQASLCSTEELHHVRNNQGDSEQGEQITVPSD